MSMAAPTDLPPERPVLTIAPQDPRGRPKMPPLGSRSSSLLANHGKMRRTPTSGSSESATDSAAEGVSSASGTGASGAESATQTNGPAGSDGPHSSTTTPTATGAAISSKISHGRSASHILAPSKTNYSRPHLARSKSSDGVAVRSAKVAHSSMAGGLGLKRSNRSLTKIAGLQPLTKSMLNQLIKPNKSNSSLKGLPLMPPLSRLKTSSKKERAILRLNEDDDDEYEDAGSSPEDDLLVSREPKDSKSSAAAAAAGTSTGGISGGGAPQLRPSSGSAFPSTDNLISQNVYGGLLLLSQSTGLTKKINELSMDGHTAHQGGMGSGPGSGSGAGGSGGASASVGSTNSENASGISFRANPIDAAAASRAAATLATTTKTVETKNGSYQPSQAAFNGLQRRTATGPSTNNNNRVGNTTVASNIYDATHTTNDFLTFLKTRQPPGGPKVPAVGAGGGPVSAATGGHAGADTSSAMPSTSHHENRTQQRLWLQRENSLMDVPTLDPTKLANFSSLSLNNLMFSHQGQSGNGESHAVINMSPAAAATAAATGTGSGVGQGVVSSIGRGTGGVASTGNTVVTPGAGGYTAALDSNSSLYGLLMNLQTSHQNSIQSRTEFERLNREYLNVRRHLNPVAESLSRTQEYFKLNSLLLNSKVTKARIGVNKTQSSSGARDSSPSAASSSLGTPSTANTFKEFSPTYQEREAEIAALVNKIWQTSLLASSSTVASAQVSPLRTPLQGYQHQQQYQQQQHQQQQHQQQPQSYYPHQQQQSQLHAQYGQHPQLQQQQGVQQQSQALGMRPSNQRLQSYTQQSYNPRNPHTPTTRAVKLAAAQQSFKKNDHLVNLA